MSDSDKKVSANHGGDSCECGGAGGAGGDDITPSGVSAQLLYRNLWLFVWLKTIGSYDSGAFSAALGTTNGIAEEWGLGSAQQGTLTSSVFLGNVIGCPLAGHLFSAYSEKHVMNGALAVHGVFTFLFATFPEYYMALFCRFFIGVSLAFIVVYTPVWVDEFAPKERQSIWMASHNAGVPIGIMMGYILATFFPSYVSVGWEWSFYIKCMLMVPTMVYIARVDSRSINTHKKSQGGGSGVLYAGEAHSNAVIRNIAVFRRKVYTLWQSVLPLLLNAVFMCSVLAMCSLYFVATGLQNFVTQYLLNEPFNASARTVMAGFGAAVVTAPVCGVIVGGILLDKVGGYQGNLKRVALFALFWGFFAASFSIVCIFVTTTTMFLIVISMVLFCGGAIIPPGAGLTMASLPIHSRSVGAALSQTLYNLLGNFSGPLLCGWVAEWTGQLKYGIMTLLISSAAGLVPMAGILIVALRGGGGVAAAAKPALVDVALVNVESGGGGGDGRLSFYDETKRGGYEDEEISAVSRVETVGAGGGAARRIKGPGYAAARPPHATTAAAAGGAAGVGGRPLQQASLPGAGAVAMSESMTVHPDMHHNAVNHSFASSRSGDGGRGAGAPYAAVRSVHEDDPSANNSLWLAADLQVTQDMSIPSQHSFGMDFVRSWLLSQSATGQNAAAPTNTGPAAAAAAAAAGNTPRRKAESVGDRFPREGS